MWTVSVSLAETVITMSTSKAEEIPVAMKSNRPLQLLDLPIDVLQIIMKEVCFDLEVVMI